MTHTRFIAILASLMLSALAQTVAAQDTVSTVLAYSAGVRIAHRHPTIVPLTLDQHSFSYEFFIAGRRTIGLIPEDSALAPDQSNPALRITGEVLVGSATGILFGLGGAFIGGAIDAGLNPGPWAGFGGAVLGAGVGYLTGIPFGVRMVGRASGKTATYGGTLLSSLGGAVIGVTLNDHYHPKGVAGIGPLVLPIVCSVLYVELVD